MIAIYDYRGGDWGTGRLFFVGYLEGDNSARSGIL